MNTDRVINDGGPAFPASSYPGSNGMSLLDWFAGQVTPQLMEMYPTAARSEIAVMAYEMAAELVKAREQ